MFHKDKHNELLAWYEWKRLCSVKRVRMPETSEGVHKRDRFTKAEREEFYLLLVNYLVRKANDICLKALGRKNIDVGENLDLFLEHFDVFMLGKKKKGGFGYVTYKDYIFYKVENPNEPGTPALKVIHGKILNFQKGGYLCDILKNFYADVNYMGDGKFKFENLESDSHDFLASPEYTNLLDAEVLAEKLLDKFNEKEMLLLYVKSKGCGASDPHVLQLIDLGHDRAASLMNDAFSRMRVFLNDEGFFNGVGASELLSVLLEKIKKRLQKTGNGYGNLLNYIEDKCSRRNAKTQENEK